MKIRRTRSHRVGERNRHSTILAQSSQACSYIIRAKGRTGLDPYLPERTNVMQLDGMPHTIRRVRKHADEVLKDSVGQSDSVKPELRRLEI
jgi:hypothetical protein